MAALCCFTWLPQGNCSTETFLQARLLNQGIFLHMYTSRVHPRKMVGATKLLPKCLFWQIQGSACSAALSSWKLLYKAQQSK